jgi:hypothetical protein
MGGNSNEMPRHAHKTPNGRADGGQGKAGTQKQTQCPFSASLVQRAGQVSSSTSDAALEGVRR